MTSFEGKFLNLEGIDGSGKGTQFGKLASRLDSEGVKYERFDFPQYGTKAAGAVEEFLTGNVGGLDGYQIAQFYAVDRLVAREKIEKALGSGALVFTNRYVGSNMAFQAGRYETIGAQNDVIRFIEHLEFGVNKLPEPDLNVITAIDYKLVHANVDSKGDRDYISGRDVNEQDTDLQRRVAAVYDRLCAERADYARVECMGKDGKMLDRDAIHQQIWDVVTKLL